MGALAYERMATFGTWEDQRATLPAIDRQFVLDRCRDHVWRFDQSQARVLEREQSLVRTMEHLLPRKPEHALDRIQAWAQERTQERAAGRQRQPQRMAALRWGLDLDDAPQGGVRVPLAVDYERGYER